MPRAGRLSRRSRTAVAAACFDRLENRLLLAADPAVWQINGTAGDDLIEVAVSQAHPGRLVARVNDVVVSHRLAANVTHIRIAAGSGDDQVNVNLGTDLAIGATVTGGKGDDTIYGGAGDDVLLGGAGRDDLHGGLGEDELDGGAGNDLLAGEEQDDRLFGGPGQDTVVGGLGDDAIFGGSGADKLSGGYGDDIVRGETGRDVVRGGDGDDALNGGQDTDTMFRASGDRWTVDKRDIWRNDFRNNPLKPVGDLDALKQRLIDEAVARYADLFGTPAYSWWRYPVYMDVVGQPRGEMAATNALGGANPSAEDHSNTNTQVDGVDEADIVKTDGDYIYLIQGSELVIVDAWPADESHVVWRTDLTGWGADLYLDGSHLTVITTQWIYDDSGWYGNPGWVVDDGIWAWSLNSEPTAGDLAAKPADTEATSAMAAVAADGVSARMIAPWWYWRPSKPQTIVTVYDVSDATSPDVISTTTLDGSLNSSRDIDGKIYLVLSNNIDIPSPEIVADLEAGKTPETGGYTYDSGYVYESEEAYRTRLEAMTLDQLFPSWETKFADGSDDTGGAIVDGSNLYAQQTTGDQTSLFSIVTIDAAADAPTVTDKTAVMGLSGEIYMSTNALYVAATGYDVPMGGWWGDPRTDLYKFGVTETGVQFEGAGQVPGWVLNSYAMDEFDGHFRIATTTQETDTESFTTSNNIFILQDTGDTLDVTGAVTGLALTERIYAARFAGEHGYLVTFRQIDPLFTVDLSDPTNPTVAGELEMPGYSSYLQPIGDGLLFGIGRDADLSGRVQGLQVSLFDVSDFANPQRLDVYKFTSAYDDNQNGWWHSWTSSPAEWDPHAISYFPDQQILAVPVLDWGWWHGDARLQLLHVDAETGFTDIGTIQHDGEVLRSLRIGEFVYSIGTDAIKIISLNDPSHEVGAVDLNLADDGGDTGGGGDVIAISPGLLGPPVEVV